MYNSKISGLGYYVPENVVTNDDLSKLMDTMMRGFKNEQVSKNVIGYPKAAKTLLLLWVLRLPELLLNGPV